MTIGIAGLVALAVVPASAGAATFADDSTADFAAGTPGTATWVVEPGSVRLSPTGLRADFDALPTGWTVTPSGGDATAAGGSLTVDGARIDSGTPLGPGQVLEFRATFGAVLNQHVGLAADLGGGPWALFSTWNGDGLYARTNGVGGDAHDLTGFDPTQPHLYRIAWTDTGVTYTVDGTWTVLHVRAIPDDMKLVASDLTPDGSAITLDWLALGPYTGAGTFESRVFDAGDTRTVWGALTQAGSGTGIAFDTRSSIDGTTFSDWAPVGAGGAIASPPGRFIQSRASLSTGDPQETPNLDRVEIGYDIDTVAPTATFGGVQVSGTTATAEFSTTAGDLARYECKLDDGAYATCASPKQLSGLAPGSHTVRARAVDTTGNVGAAAEKGFTIAAPPSDPPPSHGDDNPPPPATGGGAAADTTAPRIALAAKTLRVSKSGKVALKLRCPAGETRCSLNVQLRLGRSTLARRSAAIAGGRSATLSLTLSKAARKRLAKAKKLKVSALVVAVDAAGNRSTTTTKLTLRA